MGKHLKCSQPAVLKITVIQFISTQLQFSIEYNLISKCLVFLDKHLDQPLTVIVQ